MTGDETLLIVGDQPDNLPVLQQVFMKYLPECHVLTACGAEDGLALAVENPLSCVLIDVQMPDVDGIQMCRMIKANEETSRCPIILITSHGSNAEMRALAMESGADDLLSRPIDNIELIAKVRTMLRISRTEQELLAAQTDLESLVAQRTTDLCDSEQKWRRLFDNAIFGMVICQCITDETGHVVDYLHLDANSATQLHTGWDPNSLIGKRAMEIATPEECAEIFELSTRTIKTGEPWRMERHFPVYDRILDMATFSLGGDLIATTFSDVTERRRAEAAMEKRIVALTRPLDNPEGIAFEDLFNIDDIQHLQDEFANAAGVASVITRGDGTPITKPSNFCRLCRDLIRTTEKGLSTCRRSDAALGRGTKDGPKIQTCLGCGLWDAGAPITVGGKHVANWLIGQVRDEAQTEAGMREFAREIGADEEEFVKAFWEVPAMSRERFASLAQMLNTLAGQLSNSAYQNVQQARFISDLKAAEEQLLHEKLLSEEYINSLPGLFYVFDEKRFVRWNKAWLEVTGYSADELSQKYGPDFFEGKHRRLMEDRARQVFEEGFAEAEADLVTKDGRRIPYYFTGQRREFGGVPHFVGLGVDITDRRQAEEQRRDLEVQLRQSQKMEAIGQLAGGVAHDFNNVLTAISGNTELALSQLQQDFPQAESAISCLEQIGESAQRAASLTRQLLTFSRRDVVQPVLLCVNDVLSNLDKMLRRIVTENIALKVITDASLRAVKADARQLEQVIVNLVVNAVHAMPSGGSLTLETRNTVLDDGYVSNHADVKAGPHVLLAVSDTGKGMDAKTRERVFEPFFTTKPMDEGTGLGLSTVHGIVKQSGGHVAVYSEPGHGTTFKVYLPATDLPVSPQAPVPRPSTAPRGSETVLLCEDDESVRGLIERALRTSGYTVISAATGLEGIEAAEARGAELDLLISDVVMPGMSGRDVADELKLRHPDMRVLFVSGYAADHLDGRAVTDLDASFLQKPFGPLVLLKRVRELLEGSRVE